MIEYLVLHLRLSIELLFILSCSLVLQVVCQQIFESIEDVMNYGAMNCQDKKCEDVYYKVGDNVVPVNPNIFGTKQEAEAWAYKNCQQKDCPDLLAMEYEDTTGTPRVVCFDVSHRPSQGSQSSGSITDSMNSNNMISNQAGANTQADGAGWGSWLWGSAQTDQGASSGWLSDGLQSLFGYGAHSKVANGMQFGLNRFIIGGSGINWLLVPNYLRKFSKRVNNVVTVGNDHNQENFYKLSKNYKEFQNRTQATVDNYVPLLSGIMAGLNSVGSLIDRSNKLVIENAHTVIREATDQTRKNLEIMKPYFKPTK